MVPRGDSHVRHKALISIVFLDFKRCMYPHGYPQMAPATPRALRSGDCYGYSQLGAWRGCPHGARYLRATPLTRARPRRISGQQPLAHCRPSTRLAGSHNVTLCDASTSPPGPRARTRCRRKPIPSRARNTQGRRSHPVRLPRPQRAGFTDCHPHSREASCPRWQRATPQGHPRARGSQG